MERGSALFSRPLPPGRESPLWRAGAAHPANKHPTIRGLASVALGPHHHDARGLGASSRLLGLWWALAALTDVLRDLHLAGSVAAVGVTDALNPLVFPTGAVVTPRTGTAASLSPVSN